MRLALVISSSYTESSVVATREAFLDSATLVNVRLAQLDAGFQVVELTANRDLPENLDAILGEHQGDLEEVLVYFTGYVAVKSDRGPALLLDGSRLRAYPISRLRAALAQGAAHVQAIMDVVAMTDAGLQAAPVAADIGRALHEVSPHVSVLISAALPEHVHAHRRGCTRLTDLWLLALEYEALRAKDALVFSSDVVHTLQSERISFSDLPSFDYQPSEQDFLLIPGPVVGGYSQGQVSSQVHGSTERSLGVEPPGVETDPLLGNQSHGDGHQGDTYVDELGTPQHASDGAAEREFGTDDEPETPRPQQNPPVPFGLRLPVPPIPKVPPAAMPSSSNWVERASYLPSVPPPIVLPRLPTSVPASTPLPAPMPLSVPTRSDDWASRLSLDASGIRATPEEILILEQWVDAADQNGDPRQRIERRIRLAMQLEALPVQKAHVLREAASITFHELSDEETAGELVQEALRSDSQNAEAFDLCTEVLARQNRFAEIVQRCSEVLLRSLKPDLLYQASRHLVMLLETQGIVSIDLDATVVERLRAAVRDDHELAVRVESALSPHSVLEETLLYIQETLGQNPQHVPSLQVLSDVAERANALDTASLASSIVVCLHEARPQDEERTARLSSDGLPLVSRILTDADLEQNLLGAVANVAHLRALSGVTKAAAAAGLTKESNKWTVPKVATILDPTASTTTLARSLAWAAHFVNVNTPLLVVMPEQSVPMVLSIGDEQRLLISRQLGSGFSLAQLAFLGAKQLSYLRPELLWRVVFDSVERATNILGFCVRYAQKGEELHKWVDDELRKPAKRFVAYLDDDEPLAQLVRSAFADFEPEPSAWQLQVEQWLMAVDRAALRIGLLACANPPAAWPLISQQPQLSAMLLDEQLDEIARFAISEGHQALRKSLGLTTGT
jgi:hypothetical protein